MARKENASYEKTGQRSASQSSILAPRILNSEDLNNYHGLEYVGLYYSGGSNTVSNKPSGVSAFYLEVNRSAVFWYYQLMLPVADMVYTVWMRFWREDETWSEWTRIGGPPDKSLSTTSTNSVRNSVVTAELNKKLALTGGTMSGVLTMPKGMRVHRGRGIHGSAGYVKLVTLTVKTNHANIPIMFEVFQRNRNPRGLISVMFANEKNTDPALANFYKSGYINAYIHKSATSKWDIYVQKSENYDDIEITYYATNHTYMDPNVAIEWVNVHANSLPSGYVEATLSDLL